MWRRYLLWFAQEHVDFRHAVSVDFFIHYLADLARIFPEIWSFISGNAKYTCCIKDTN